MQSSLKLRKELDCKVRIFSHRGAGYLVAAAILVSLYWLPTSWPNLLLGSRPSDLWLGVCSLVVFPAQLFLFFKIYKNVSTLPLSIMRLLCLAMIVAAFIFGVILFAEAPPEINIWTNGELRVVVGLALLEIIFFVARYAVAFALLSSASTKSFVSVQQLSVTRAVAMDVAGRD